MPPDEEPISRDGRHSLAEEVVERLTASIRDGVILPGRKLPAESALIDRFGVSRTVIREALSRLHAAGLIETYRGKGSFVLTRPSDHSFSLDSDLFKSVSDIVELVDFRLGIEVESAGLAANRYTDVQLQRLEEAAAALRSNPDNPGKAVEADFAFHHSVALATGNRFYADLIDSLGPAMIVLPRERLAVQDDHPSGGNRFDRICDEHDAIYSAIANHDELASRAAMRLHLVNSRERLRGRG